MCYGQESIISEEESCRFRIEHQAEILDDCTNLLKYVNASTLEQEEIEVVDKIAQRLVYAADDIKKCTAPFLLKVCKQNISIPNYPLYLMSFILRMDDTFVKEVGEFYLQYANVSEQSINFGKRFSTAYPETSCNFILSDFISNKSNADRFLHTPHFIYFLEDKMKRDDFCSTFLSATPIIFNSYLISISKSEQLMSFILSTPLILEVFNKELVKVKLSDFIIFANNINYDENMSSIILDKYLNHAIKPIVRLCDSAHIDNLPEHNKLVQTFKKDYKLHATYYCRIVKDLLDLSCDKEMIQASGLPTSPNMWSKEYKIQERNLYFNSEILYIEMNMNNGKELLAHFVLKLKELKLFNPFVDMLAEFQTHNVMCPTQEFSDKLQTTSAIIDHPAILPVDICVNILEFLI